jgi:hypothetical protein
VIRPHSAAAGHPRQDRAAVVAHLAQLGAVSLIRWSNADAHDLADVPAAVDVTEAYPCR